MEGGRITNCGCDLMTASRDRADSFHAKCIIVTANDARCTWQTTGKSWSRTASSMSKIWGSSIHRRLVRWYDAAPGAFTSHPRKRLNAMSLSWSKLPVGRPVASRDAEDANSACRPAFPTSGSMGWGQPPTAEAALTIPAIAWVGYGFVSTIYMRAERIPGMIR